MRVGPAFFEDGKVLGHENMGVSRLSVQVVGRERQRLTDQTWGKVRCLACRNALIDSSPDNAWDVLAHGRSYAEWVVGTGEVRSVDPTWPAEGSRLTYLAGAGPLKVVDQ
jgi:hypothetical protein